MNTDWNLRCVHNTEFLKGISGEWSEGTVIQMQMDASTYGKDLSDLKKKYSSPSNSLQLSGYSSPLRIA